MSPATVTGVGGAEGSDPVAKPPKAAVDADVHVAPPSVEPLLEHMEPYWADYVANAELRLSPTMNGMYPPVSFLPGDAEGTVAPVPATLAELRDGIGDTGILPALIGEIGTNHPPRDSEWRALRAAGRAGAETGAAVNVHLSWRGADGLDVVEALVAERMPADRIILSHMDERLDRGYHKAVAETGAVLEYDTFGSDFLYGSLRTRNPSDAERVEMATWLLSEGYAEQLVIACDTWTKANLRRNGGFGYEHLFRRIVPALREIAGADDAAIQAITVETPRRLLDR
jgi:predicted metal-dependent phosphotriesterase family hydrolase